MYIVTIKNITIGGTGERGNPNTGERGVVFSFFCNKSAKSFFSKKKRHLPYKIDMKITTASGLVSLG